MKIVSDSSVIISLWRIERIQLLPTLFGEILIPPAVVAEIGVHGKAGSDIFQQLEWLKPLSVRDLNLPKLVQSLAGFRNLDAGETEAIALALAIQADAILIDEHRGRNVAERAGLRVTGVLGILLLAKNQGLLMEIRPVLDDLIAVGFRLDASLYQRMITLAGEAL